MIILYYKIISFNLGILYVHLQYQYFAFIEVNFTEHTNFYQHGQRKNTSLHTGYA